jgi:hypothetical protein
MSVKFSLYKPEGGEPAEYIEVTFAPPAPGSVADVMFRPATDEDREKYATEYRAFAKTGGMASTPEQIREAFVPTEVAPKSHVKPHKKG